MARNPKKEASETKIAESPPKASSDAAGAPPTAPAPVENSSILDYYSKKEWVVYLVLVVLGFILRWHQLEARPLHHDESIHANFAKSWYDNPAQNFYKYDPTYHGGTLYELYRLTFSTFGVTNWGLRAPMALIGCLLIIAPLLFRNYLSKMALFAITGAISFSPTLIYWSRFSRHDPLVLSGLLLILIGTTTAKARFRLPLIAIGAALHLCSKEDIYVHLAMLAGYIAYETFFFFSNKVRRESQKNATGVHWVLWITAFAQDLVVRLFSTVFKHFTNYNLDRLIRWVALAALIIIASIYAPSDIRYRVLIAGVLTFAVIESLLALANELPHSSLQLARGHIAANKLPLLIAVIAGLLIYVYFFSSGFHYRDGLNAPRLAWEYWTKQHLTERISGPFLFNFYTLAWYELPFVLLAILHYFHVFARAGAPLRSFVVATWLGVIVLPWILSEYKIVLAEKHFPLGVRLKDTLDAAGFIIYISHSLVLTTFHLIRGERALAFWGYLFSAGLFCYSVLNEKVPWLAMYPFIAGLIYFTLYFDAYFKQHPLPDWREFPWYKALLGFGAPCILLGIVFRLEEAEASWLRILRDDIFRAWKEGPHDFIQHWWFFLLGLLIIWLAGMEWKFRFLKTFNLALGLAVLVGAYNLRASILTNFTYAGEAREYISQVHTTKETHELSLRLRSMIEYPLQGFRPVVALTGEPSWPIFWYLRDMPTLRFDLRGPERAKADYIIQDFSDEPKELPEGFVPIQIKLRGWWVPDFSKMTLKKFLNYAINHTPWGDTGFSYAHLFVNTKTIPQERL